MNAIVIGAGLAGATAARLMADNGWRVLVLERQPRAGGSCFDEVDEYGITVQRHGPHILHTDSERAFAFLSRFAEWIPLRHRVKARIGGMYVPVPFDLDSVDMCFDPDTARVCRERLLARYGDGGRATVLSLRREADETLRRLGDYVYENVFRQYSLKQWGEYAAGLDSATLSRVPVNVSRGGGYFADKYQCVPRGGFTDMISRMLAHPNIELRLGEDGAKRLSFAENGMLFDGEPCVAPVIYTGRLDGLLPDGKPLPYRTLMFETEHLDIERFQPATVVNYTVSEQFTRITEFKYLTGCESAQGTTICREYPMAFTDESAQTPYYPIPNEASRALYADYARRIAPYRNLAPLGRLAEYKYYDMDDTVERAMAVVEALK